jgi:hypothetical protein
MIIAISTTLSDARRKLQAAQILFSDVHIRASGIWKLTTEYQKSGCSEHVFLTSRPASVRRINSRSITVEIDGEIVSLVPDERCEILLFADHI